MLTTPQVYKSSIKSSAYHSCKSNHSFLKQGILFSLINPNGSAHVDTTADVI